MQVDQLGEIEGANFTKLHENLRHVSKDNNGPSGIKQYKHYLE